MCAHTVKLQPYNNYWDIYKNVYQLHSKPSYKTVWFLEDEKAFQQQGQQDNALCSSS